MLCGALKKIKHSYGEQMNFKPGDIVVCLVDFPHGANIQKGEKAIVMEVNGASLYFKTYPVSNSVGNWATTSKKFKLYRTMYMKNK